MKSKIFFPEILHATCSEANGEEITRVRGEKRSKLREFTKGFGKEKQILLYGVPINLSKSEVYATPIAIKSY